MITEASAFIDYNFAPPCLRRDVAILGLIHKRALGLAHVAYEQLLPFAPLSWYSLPRPPQHNKQLNIHRDLCIYKHNMFNRSIFGMVDVYNRLSQRMVNYDSVKSFQSELTKIAKQRCARGEATWKTTFSCEGFAQQDFV